MAATVSSIPASQYVNVIPSVLSAGGAALQMSGLFLTTNTRIPIGTIQNFPNVAAVSAYFGPTDPIVADAQVYFTGPNLATQVPAALLMAQYPNAAVSGYLRGGSVAAFTLAQIQAISGSLIVSVDGTVRYASSVNLSAATSLSSASQIMSAAFGITGPTAASVIAQIVGTTMTVFTALSGSIVGGGQVTGGSVASGTFIVAQLTGATGGVGTYSVNVSQSVTSSVLTVSQPFITYDVVAGAFVATSATTGASSAVGFFNPNAFSVLTITGQPANNTTLTFNGTVVTFVTSGATGNQVTIGASAAATFTALLTFLNASSDAQILKFSFAGSSNPNLICSAVAPGAAGTNLTVGIGVGSNFTGTSGALTQSIAGTLGLTAATGAVVSPGAVAATPAAYMAGIIAQNQNWATLVTLFDPDGGSGNTVKQAFAAWANSTGNDYLYVCWDTDVTPTTTVPATNSLGYILSQAQSSGTALVWVPSGINLHHAAFVAGFVASINWGATNGRMTAAFKGQAGLVPAVTSGLAASNLTANGYSFYGAVATRSAAFNFLSNGSETGPYLWIDSYINQIWLNAACQEALIALLTSVGTIPYNPTGYGYIRHALTSGASSSQVALPPASPVAAALNNGVIAKNVPLSATEIVAANALAGQKVDGLLSTQGWALAIQPATAQVRAARHSPTIILIYMDGGSVQQINLSSVLVQ